MLKRYKVTQSIRFPSNIMKMFFYAGLALLPISVVVILLGLFIDALTAVRAVCTLRRRRSQIGFRLHDSGRPRRNAAPSDRRNFRGN